MCKLLRVCLPLMFVALSATVEAREPTTGASLWTGCSADFDSQSYYESYAACRAYIIGVADVLSAGGRISSNQACIPDSATKAEITERVIGWLRANPSTRGTSPAHILVAEAIGRAYPCT